MGFPFTVGELAAEGLLVVVGGAGAGLSGEGNGV
ncbi:hypothetical protein IWX81_001628 [Salinibacterium sp. CAN_S4]